MNFQSTNLGDNFGTVLANLFAISEGRSQEVYLDSRIFPLQELDLICR